MTEQGEQRPLTRRELRERQMRDQQLHVETADEAAALTGEHPTVGQRRHGQASADGEAAQPNPEELERRAQEYAEIEKQIDISPVDEDGNPRTRREMRALFHEEFERIFAEREAERTVAEEPEPETDLDESSDVFEPEAHETDAVTSEAEQPAEVTSPSSFEEDFEPASESSDVVTPTDPGVEPESLVEQSAEESVAQPESETVEETAESEDGVDEVEDDLPPTEALTLDDLFDNSTAETTSESENGAVDEAAAAVAPASDAVTDAEAPAVEQESKGGWLSRLRKKKHADAEVAEDAATEESEPAASTEDETEPEAQPSPDADDGLAPTEALNLGNASSFEDLLNESVEAEASAVAEDDTEPQADSEPEDHESADQAKADGSDEDETITDIDEAIEAENTHVDVEDQSVDVEAEEFDDESAALNEILPDEETDDSEDNDEAAEDTQPKSAASGGYSFPNIVPLEETEPVFDNNSERDLENSKTGFDNLISRAVAEESSANTSNGTSALILPSMPHSDGISGPIGQTGELFVSGSIELPKSLGETGGHRLSAESLGLDDDQDGDSAEYTDEHGSTPVSAVRAVSAQNTNYSIVSPEKKDHSKKPMIFALSGGALVLVVGGVIYWGATSGLFG